MPSATPASASPQPGQRPSGVDPAASGTPTTTRTQPRTKQRSDTQTIDKNIAASPATQATPGPQLESDLPPTAFAAVLSGLSEPEHAENGATKGTGLRKTSASLPQMSSAAPASIIVPAMAAIVPVPEIVPATATVPAGVPDSVVAPPSVTAPTPVVAPASIALPLPVAAPGQPVRVDGQGPQSPSTNTASPKATSPQATGPQVTSMVPQAGSDRIKPPSVPAAPPIPVPQQRDVRPPRQAAFEQPAAVAPGAGVHVPADRGRAGDPPAPEGQSGRSTGGFQKAAALETPEGVAVMSPAASTPQPLAFAARLVERPPAVNTGEDIPAPDAKTQAPAGAEAGAQVASELPISSGAATQAPVRTAPLLAPADPAEPAPSPEQPPAKPEDPQHPFHPSVEPTAAAPRREDAGNPPWQPKLVHSEPAENLQAPAHGPAPGSGAAVAGLERPPVPTNAESSLPAGQEHATDRADAAPQARTGSAPPETSAAPAQNISVRLSSDGHPAIEVRVMDRGGEVRVAVHSPDTATSESVRAGLPELVDRLGQRGYETEIWRPPAAASSSRAQGESSGGPFGRGGQQDPAGREQQHPQRQPQPAWLEELDSNLNPNPNRSTFSWRP
jgi:hypothetical protein